MYLPVPSPCGYFMLPSEAADKGLRLAGAAQLKVLITVYRNMSDPRPIGEIAALTGLSEGDTRDALDYWVGRGLLVRQDEEEKKAPAPPARETAPANAEAAAESPKEPDAAENAPPREKKRVDRTVRPTIDQINRRCGEDPEILDLFRQAQKILGRTLGYDTQAPLLLCVDYLGLPTTVVLLICQYAKMNGKSGFSYIISIAEDWAYEGVDTIEAANERIAAMETASALWKPFAARIGNANPAPSKKQSEYLFKWSTQYGYGLDEIALAYDEMADHTSSFSFAYMDKVLTNWRAEGLKDARQIARRRQELQEQKAQRSAPSPAKAASAGTPKTKKDRPTGRAAVSYDIAAAENAAAQGAPVYERKKKKP